MLCGTVTFPESDALWNDGCGAYANHNCTMLRNEFAWCLIIQWSCWICKHSSSDKLRVLILKNTQTRSSHLTQKVPCTSVAALAWTQATLVIELCGPGIFYPISIMVCKSPKSFSYHRLSERRWQYVPTLSSTSVGWHWFTSPWTTGKFEEWNTCIEHRSPNLDFRAPLPLPFEGPLRIAKAVPLPPFPALPCNCNCISPQHQTEFLDRWHHNE